MVEQLVASQEGVSSMELVGYIYYAIWRTVSHMLCILREVSCSVRSNYGGVGKFGTRSTHEEVKNLRKNISR
jgi:hypothetical protein